MPRVSGSRTEDGSSGSAGPPASRAAATADLTSRLAAVRCLHPFRRYQELALAAFERSRASGDRRIYLTMPPGSGKTLLGLEIGRRLGRPIVSMSPTTAIQGQWIAQWTGSFGPELVPAVTDGTRAGDLAVGDAGLLALTYQSLVVLDTEPDDDGPPTDGSTRASQRRLVAAAGDAEAILGLLHPNGRAILDALAATGPITLILDECHHLLRLWGHVLEAVIGRLHADSVVLGLTATPPTELGAREAILHRALFGGTADFEVVTPAVVKDGYLAPYQELALLVPPLDAERRFIAQEQERFVRLRSEVTDPDFASVPFAAWFARRFLDRRSPDGATVGWTEIERADPVLARAALRLRWSREEAPPHGARYREQDRVDPGTPDWIALLEAWAVEVLVPGTEAVDQAALDRIRRALPSVGYRWTRHGVAAMASVTDRVLQGSGAKPAAVVRVLEAEAGVLGDRLRAVVLCDHERAGLDPGTRLRGVLEPGAGSAALMLRTLLAVPGTRALDPVLVTGRTVAASRRTAADLARFAADDPVAGVMLAGFDALAASGAVEAVTGTASWDEAVEIDPPHPGWASGVWVPLLTRFLEAGRSRCLVGTRALLGEGWDCPSLNVLVDLGAATTAVSTHQVRGRSLRLDPADPAKVADNWDIVCVAPDHDGGAADYGRFVRRHADYYALTSEGEIESGVSHVDPELTPFAPPPAGTFDAITHRMLARPAGRQAVHAAWRVGEPYRDVPARTIRVRMARSPGLPVQDVWRATPHGRFRGGVRAGVVATIAAAFGALVAGSLWGSALVGVIMAVAIVAGVGLWAAAVMRSVMTTLGPPDTLGDIARAVAEALVAAGLNEPAAGPETVHVTPQVDGYYRCLIDGAGEADSGRFARALEEVLAPMWEPRWMIARRVVTEPPTLPGALRFLAARILGRAGPGVTVRHALPEQLATSQARVAAFERAWGRWVAPGQRAVRATTPAGEAILAAHRGEDPYRVETQQRTLWT